VNPAAPVSPNENFLEPYRNRTGRLFVLSGPSGVGKDTLLDHALASLPGIVRSVSATTRPARATEKHGTDYYFTSLAEFETGIAEGNFLEYARYGEHLYGTPRETVLEQLRQGQDVLLKIEVQGAALVRQAIPEAILIFVAPPSLNELERRLRGRNTDTAARIQARLAIARDELALIPRYDYLIVNDHIETAADTLRAIILAERCRLHTSPWLTQPKLEPDKQGFPTSKTAQTGI
jgi:guanylate kinase